MAQFIHVFLSVIVAASLGLTMFVILFSAFDRRSATREGPPRRSDANGGGERH